MKRREFMKTSIASLAATVCQASSASASKVKPAGRLKFCVFSDIHYNPGVWPHGETEYLDRILKRAKDGGSDFIIQLGDFTHRVDRQLELDYIRRYNTCGIPAYHVLGNHDGERGEGGYRLAMEKYGMPSSHYFFDRGGWRFIVGDPNYMVVDGKYVHFEGGNLREALKQCKVKMCNCIPPEQVEWIASTISDSPFPCVFFSHQSVERGGSVANGREIMKIFNEANRKSPGKVRLVVNGHHHCDHVSVKDDIVYLDLNSASYAYFVKRHDKFPPEYIKNNRAAVHTVIWNDPLSAEITVDEKSVRIAGSRSSFFMGVTPEAAGYRPVDDCARQIAPMVSSFDYVKNFMYGTAAR